MRTTDIRRLFLDYFRERGHQLVPSSSLVPDDPTLLLTTAGMVQFKPYFLGESSPPKDRLVSLQKCVRTVDIDNIGTTDRHSTFFEMLGNFSFGDYGKAIAVPWAYEFLTDVLGLAPERLWATVYREDDEAVELWRRVGIPIERIQRLGVAENYWDTGGPGPCGPCSEIFYDRGPAYGREGGPAVDTDRYLEVWNLVFMRYLRGEGGDENTIPIVGDLPRPCLESGLGLERVAMVLQGVDTIHDIDVMAPVMARLGQLTGADVRAEGQRRPARIVVDHVRAAAFLLADGVLPSNEGRGYVLRRLLRRAIRHGRALGVDHPFLHDLAGTVVDQLGQVWPELTERRGLVEQAMGHEEDGFGRTLVQGARLLDTAIRRTREEAVRRSSTSTTPTTPAQPELSGRPVLSGRTAFELHDTFGFPVDLTTEIAAEAGLVVDTDRFEALMDEQRRRAQRARGEARTQGDDRGRGQAYRTILDRTGATRFVGHDRLTEEGSIIGLVRDGTEVPAALEGEHVEVVLDRTPFYAESGGQVGDAGVIRTPDGSELRVVDTGLGAGGDLHVHRAEVVRGELRVGQSVHAVVDDDRRSATARSHSATHVLHAVLRDTLGDHARQHGSLVAPGRLRFDVTHFAPIEPDALARIQDEVNQRLLSDPEVRIWQASRAEAQEAGAIALFGETYGEVVRVVDIGDFSRELCGGTHVGHGSQAGPVRLVGETSVGSGVRRIEALTGLDALRYSDHERVLVDQIAALLGVPRSGDILRRLQGRLDALARAEGELADVRQRERAKLAERLAGKGRDAGGRWIVAERLDPPDVRDGHDAKQGEEIPALVDGVLAHCPPGRPGGAVLGMVRDGKAQLVLGINPAMEQLTAPARDLLRPAGRTIGGGAGGVGRIAHAGGREVNRLDQALAQAAHHLATSTRT
ncbi:alanine--tRNA ligase [Actinopolymorpha sp. B9G3]|uniref:alanine--tRNA ligase n=1 Tax=Actinopolymorpha sp. B9G3 TaxID=3158970 RepID=UPI0032D9412C